LPLDSVLEDTVNEIIQEIKYQVTVEERLPFRALFKEYYKTDDTKPGNKKLVSRQPEVTKEWRDKIKRLLKKYLKLKMEASFDSNEDGRVYLHQTKSSVCRSQDSFRFKVKIENSVFWYELSRMRLSGRYSLLSFEKKGARNFALLSNKEGLLFQEGLLTRIFNGSHLESICSRQGKKMPDPFWSAWKTVPKKNGDTAPDHPTDSWWEYQNYIHPVIKKAALEILKDLFETQPNVVEICGGEGELAIEIAKQYPNKMNYYLLEYNDLCIQRVQEHVSTAFVDKESKKLIPIKTDVTNVDDYFTDTKKQRSMENDSIDLVIGSGALTECVLENKKAALKVASKCYDLLKPGGKMVLAGHASSFLHIEDFTSLGFIVINSLLVGLSERFTANVDNEFFCVGRNEQFYILEKAHVECKAS